MLYKVAFYDWNGTLANDREIGYACVVKIFQTFAPNIAVPSVEEWRAGNDNVNFIEFYYRRGIPRSVTIDDLRAVWAPRYRSLAISRPLTLAPGAMEVLLFCARKNIPNVVVSSSIDDVEQHLRDANVHHLLHTILVQVRDKKSTLARVVSKLGIMPQEAFYVNDTHDGLVEAKEAGLTAIGFTGGFNREERVRAANPDHVVHSFFEILAILQDSAAR
jgi:phosphoglycolate phosphatase